jgi:hypothetical protein
MIQVTFIFKLYNSALCLKWEARELVHKGTQAPPVWHNMIVNFSKETFQWDSFQQFGLYPAYN